MKKTLLSLVILTFALSGVSMAEEPAAPAETQSSAAAAPSAEMFATEAPAPAALDTIPAEPQDSTLVDNLEFISGEVAEMDEAAKTVSVRLYGDAEEAASDKVLKVNVDENTDITDGEQDRDLKSLTAGTEVDVEYDPATNKATYIFVY
jgi:hypothetical protein